MKLKYIITYICILLCSLSFAQTPTTVYTCKNTAVDAVIRSEMSQQDITYYNNAANSQYSYLGVTFMANSSLTYNCHSYAWHLREGNTWKVWINNTTGSWNGSCYDNTLNIADYWTDGCFIQVCNETDADKVHYYCGDHSAAKSTTHAGYWESKWGYLPVYRHLIGNVDYAQPSSRNYYASTVISQVGQD